MKAKRTIILVLLLAMTLIFIGTGCAKPVTPFDRAQSYVNAWNHQDFDAMYQLLSPNVKQTESHKAFVSRYKAIYSGIEANHLHITLQKPAKNQGSNKKDTRKTFTYHVQMGTLAGALKYNGSLTLNKVTTTKQQKKTNQWFVNWNPSLIIQSLKPGQTVHVTNLPATRGEILDRNGEGLAINGTAVQIGIYPKKWQDSVSKQPLADLLGLSPDFIDQQLAKSWVTPDTFVPIKTVSALNSQLISEASDLPGVLTKDVPARVYPCGKACAPLIGYVGPISSDVLKAEPSTSGYTENSIIGKKGLENVFEDQLRARNGADIQILDRNKQPVKTLAKRAPKNGKTIKLTIDSTVQESLYNQLQGDLGTAVAMNPKTGDVLGMVSTPTFDPNQFVLGISTSDYQNLLNDPDQPLLNRFTQTYAPGSSLKPLVAAIGLNQDVLNPDEALTIKGKDWQKDASWGNYYVHRLDYLGQVNLRDALVYSDNIYFAQTALKIGGQNLVDGLENFGFGERVPFAYPLAKSQVSNSGALKSSLLIANSGYGQGEVKVNPLHLAVDFSAFVNQGNLIQPKLILNESDRPTYWKKGVISAENAALISKDLEQVVQSPEGTAYKPYVAGLSIAGKTGTAEFKSKQGTTGKEDGWFVAYNTNPSNLLISMMVENVQDKGGSHYVVGKVKQAFTELK